MPPVRAGSAASAMMRLLIQELGGVYHVCRIPKTLSLTDFTLFVGLDFPLGPFVGQTGR